MRWSSVRKQRKVLILSLILITPFLSVLIDAVPFVPRVEEVLAAEPWAPQPTTWVNISGSPYSQSWIFRVGYPPAPFSVNIEVDNVTDLFAWEFKLRWNASILNFASATEGPFLDGDFDYAVFEDEADWDYVLVNNTLTSGSGVDGSGRIATVGFTVQASGETPLDLYETTLADSIAASLKHGVTDGCVLAGDVNFYTLFYVTPQTSIANTGEFFNVTVWMDEVYDLFAWEFTLEWDPFYLIEAVNFTDHRFLGVNSGFASNTGLGWAAAGATLLSLQDGVTGSGRLATITFQVSPYGYLGATSLNFTHTNATAIDIDWGPVPPEYEYYEIEERTVFGGYFRTSIPHAEFSFTPERPAVDITSVTFNATNSTDLTGGSIVSYHWDFNDTTTKDTTNPVVTHTFNQVRDYYVNLTVTDDEDETASTEEQVTVVYRDITVTGLAVSHQVAMVGTLVDITVSVENNGTGYKPWDTESFEVEVSVLNETGSVTDFLGTESITLAKGENANPHFTWDTTGVDVGTYTIHAVVPPLTDENDEENNDANATTFIAAFNLYDYPVEVGGLTFHVFVNSTSDLTGFYFNKSMKEVGFNVTGLSGLSSYCNVTIPKHILKSENLAEWTILFDANPTILTPSITENVTHTFLYFDYTLSEHNIQIIGTTGPGVPVSNFTYSPIKDFTFMDDIVTFNASASDDPDGNITKYFFDFDDGSNATGTAIYDSGTGTLLNVSWVYKEGTTVTPPFNTSQPILNHIFKKPAIGVPFNVTLTVTDNDPGFSDTSFDKLQVFWPFDIAVSDITTSGDTVNIGEILTINVTVTNMLDHESLLVFNLAFLGNSSVLTAISGTASTPLGNLSGTSVTVLFDWNTSNVALGIYTLKAEVEVTRYDVLVDESDFPPELNIANNIREYGDVLVKKWDSAIDMDASPTTTTIGSSVIINGTLSPTLSGVNITIQSKLGENDWSNIATVLTRLGSQFLHVWTPTVAGSYQVRASWPGDAVTSANVSNVETVTVNKLSSTITLEVDPSSITLGSRVTLSGQIEPSRSNVQVTIYVRKDGGDWSAIPTSTTTDDEGSYSFEWEPTDAGTFEVQAKWAGDADTLASESDVTQVQVDEPGGIPMWVIYAAAGIAIIVVAGVVIYFLKFSRAK